MRAYHIKSVKSLISFAFIVSLLILNAIASEAKLAENPHNSMECSNCHVGNVSFDKPLQDPEYVEKDIVGICLKCHSEIMYVHHPQRVQVTTAVPDYLPVGEGNSITCLTCHYVHLKDTSMHLLRTSSIGNYTSRIDICYECHKENFKKISPHKSEAKGLSCLICHRETPTIKDTRETVTLVSESIEKMCNFCHNILVDKHPLNVDETIKLSNKLPFSKDKKIICITCHDPHGTLNTINFLREEYVIALEFGKYENPHNVHEYFNCLKCHVAIPSIKEYEKCKYDEDYILLCYNCHGTDEEKCHTINIPLSDGMILPDGFKLNEDDLISCITCHDPDCSGDIRIRYRNLNYLREESCDDCHNFSGIKSLVLHTGLEDKSTCYYCHKINQKIGDFDMSEKFICLKCHRYKKHPANVEHIVKPKSTMDFIEEIKLDRKGKVRCTTCHDPHSTDEKNNKLRVFENITICEACHQM